MKLSCLLAENGGEWRQLFTESGQSHDGMALGGRRLCTANGEYIGTYGGRDYFFLFMGYDPGYDHPVHGHYRCVVDCVPVGGILRIQDSTHTFYFERTA